MKIVVQDIFLNQMQSIQNNIFNIHKDLPFLPESKKIEKGKKLVGDIEDTKKYVIHIRALK